MIHAGERRKKKKRGPPPFHFLLCAPTAQLALSITDRKRERGLCDRILGSATARTRDVSMHESTPLQSPFYPPLMAAVSEMQGSIFISHVYAVPELCKHAFP